MKTIDVKVLNVLIFLYLVVVIFFGCSCNPVKQVLKDKKKLDKVAEAVISAGYCANDTIIQLKSDTTIKYDTAFLTDTISYYKQVNDTAYVKVNVPKIITKSITIHDTIKSVVVDGARVLLCEKRLNESELNRIKYQQLAKERFWYLFWLILIFIIYLSRKKILRLIRWYILKY